MKKIILFFVFISTLNNTLTAQWQQTSQIIGTYRSIVENGSNIFAGDIVNGVFMSSDSGANWTSVCAGLTSNCVSSLVTSDTTIYAGVYGGGVFISKNNGTSWIPKNNGLTDNTVLSLLIDGTNILAGTESGIFLSTNEGLNWVTANNGLPQTGPGISSIIKNGTNIFASSFGSGVFLSTNNGLNWTAVNNGLPSNSDFTSFAINGTSIFVGNEGGGIFSSNNNGINWSAVNNGLTNLFIYSLHKFGSYIFAGSYGKAFLSNNNGTSWTEISNGLPNSSILCLKVIGSEIFAGTENHGIWKCSLSDVAGIEDIAFNKNEFTFYPNPANDVITIELQCKINEVLQLSIYNMSGVLIKREILEQKKQNIDINELYYGIYMLEISSKDWKKYQKLIIQK